MKRRRSAVSSSPVNRSSVSPAPKRGGVRPPAAAQAQAQAPARPFAETSIQEGWLASAQIPAAPGGGYSLPAWLAAAAGPRAVLAKRPRPAVEMSAAEVASRVREGRFGVRVHDGWRRRELLDELKAYAAAHPPDVADAVMSNQFVEMLALQRVQQLLRAAP